MQNCGIFLRFSYTFVYDVEIREFQYKNREKFCDVPLYRELN